MQASIYPNPYLWPYFPLQNYKTTSYTLPVMGVGHSLCPAVIFAWQSNTSFFFSPSLHTLSQHFYSTRGHVSQTQPLYTTPTRFQRFGWSRKNSFIALPSKGGHSRLTPQICVLPWERIARGFTGLAQGVPLKAQWLMNLRSTRLWVWSLASLIGLRSCHCCELGFRSQTPLKSSVTVAVA